MQRNRKKEKERKKKEGRMEKWKKTRESKTKDVDERKTTRARAPTYDKSSDAPHPPPTSPTPDSSPTSQSATEPAARTTKPHPRQGKESGATWLCKLLCILNPDVSDSLRGGQAVLPAFVTNRQGRRPSPRFRPLMIGYNVNFSESC